MNKRIIYIALAILACIIVGSTVVMAEDGGDFEGEFEPIESADDNPTVREVGSYRLLTSNSENIDSFDGVEDVYMVTARDIGLRQANVSEPAVRIDNHAFTLEQARQFGALTDGYRETLYTPTILPQEDSWQDYIGADVEDIHTVGVDSLGNESEDSDDVQVYATISGQPGQVPVRNAEIRERRVSGEEYVANPTEAEVYDGDMISYDEINQRSVDLTFGESDRTESYVPLEGDTEDPLYETKSVEREGELHDEETFVKDHFVGTARVTEGALYDDFWIANPDGIEITLMADWRAVVPYTENNRYEEESECTYSCNCDEDGCQTCKGTDTDYEYYEWEGYSEFFEIRADGEWYEAPDENNVIVVDDTPEGTYRIANVIGAEYTRYTGTDSTCPGNTEGPDPEEFVVPSNNFQDIDHPIQPAKIDDLDITVYLADKDPNQELYVEVEGDQRPEENPLDRVVVEDTNRDEVWTMRTPWVAYPQSLYSSLDYRTESGDLEVFTSVNEDATLPNLHRDYLDGNTYRSGQHDTIRVYGGGQEKAQIYEGINVGEYVVDTVGDVELWGTYGGRIGGSESGKPIGNLEAEATDLFGNTMEVDVEHVEYVSTNIEYEYNSDSDKLEGTLLDEDGNGVGGRQISISGGDTSEVTTDQNGDFEVGFDKDTVTMRMEFEGDPLRANLDAHYDETTTRAFTGHLHVQAVNTPIGYVSDMISNVMIFANWIALGIFFVWWAKYRESNV